MKNQPKKRWKKNTWIILQIVIGIFLGLLIINFISYKLLSIIGTTLVFIPFFFISIFISINIHEFGHFIFGRILGFKLIFYRVGIFSWHNENEKMKFSIIKNKGYSGQCGMISPNDLPNYANLLHLSGGIALNILYGIGFILLALYTPNMVKSINLFFSVLGYTSLILGIENLLPLVIQNNPLDGKIIWSLILKKPFAKKLIESNRVISQLSAGIRPRDMCITLIPENNNLQVYDIITILYLYFKALDENNLENMLHYVDVLEKNLASIPEIYLNAVYYEISYLGCITNNEARAKMYYEKAGKHLQADKDVNGIRVKAYYEYYINKDIKTAMIFCDTALTVADRFPIKGQGLMEKDLVEALKKLMTDNKVS